MGRARVIFLNGASSSGKSAVAKVIQSKVSDVIFLHVADGGLTAGCVAMPRSDVRWLVRWLDPDRHPRVAMGPRKYVARL